MHDKGGEQAVYTAPAVSNVPRGFVSNHGASYMKAGVYRS